MGSDEGKRLTKVDGQLTRNSFCHRHKTVAEACEDVAPAFQGREGSTFGFAPSAC